MQRLVQRKKRPTRWPVKTLVRRPPLEDQTHESHPHHRACAHAYEHLRFHASAELPYQKGTAVTLHQGFTWRLLAACICVFLFGIDLRYRLGDGISFTHFEVAAWACGVMFLIRDPRRAAFVIRQQWPIFAWVGWVLFAGVFAIQFLDHAAIAPLMKNTLPAAWLFFVLSMVLRTESDVIWILRALFLGVGSSCILGIFQAVTGQGYVYEPDQVILQKLAFDGARITRVAMGPFVHPNNFGLFLGPIIALAFVLCLKAPRLAYKCGAPAFLLLAVPALYLTYVKGAVLWILIAVVGAMAPRFFRRPWFVAPLVAAVGLGIFAAGVAASASSRVLGTIATRALLWDNAFAMILGSPDGLIIGSDPMAVAYRAKATLGALFPHAHNGWINQALFFGLPAAVFFAFAWVKALGHASQHRQGQELGVAVTAMLVTFGGMLIFENVSTTSIIALTGLAAALAVASMRLATPDRKQKPGPQTLRRKGAPLRGRARRAGVLGAIGR